MTYLPDDAARDEYFIAALAGVRISVAPRDAVTADVALAIAGMFEHELGAATPSGGLHNLDAALGGALVRLRSDGIFKGEAGESMMLTATAPPVLASNILLLGQGAPELWAAHHLRETLRKAASEAVHLKVPSAAFAPGLLDSGLKVETPDAVADAMLGGLLDALGASDAAPRALVRWIFCTGAAHLADTVSSFRAACAKYGRQ